MEPYRAYNRGCSGMTPRSYGNGRMQSCNMQPPKCNIQTPKCEEHMDIKCKKENDDCKDSNRHMRNMPIGMGYVPIQDWCKLYDPETAFCQGTAFPDLNLIFCGSRGKM